MTRSGRKDPGMSNFREIKVQIRSLVSLQAEAEAWAERTGSRIERFQVWGRGTLSVSVEIQQSQASGTRPQA